MEIPVTLNRVKKVLWWAFILEQWRINIITKLTIGKIKFKVPRMVWFVHLIIDDAPIFVSILRLFGKIKRVLFSPKDKSFCQVIIMIFTWLGLECEWNALEKTLPRSISLNKKITREYSLETSYLLQNVYLACDLISKHLGPHSTVEPSDLWVWKIRLFFPRILSGQSDEWSRKVKRRSLFIVTTLWHTSSPACF